MQSVRVDLFSYTTCLCLYIFFICLNLYMYLYIKCNQRGKLFWFFFLYQSVLNIMLRWAEDVLIFVSILELTFDAIFILNCSSNLTKTEVLLNLCLFSINGKRSITIIIYWGTCIKTSKFHMLRTITWVRIAWLYQKNIH